LCLQFFSRLTQFDVDADVLAFDWNGRQYMTAVLEGSSEPVVLLADINTGTVSRLCTLDRFEAVISSGAIEDFFEGDLFASWRAAACMPQATLSFTECVAYETPFWCGGDDSIASLRLVSVESHWTKWVQVLHEMVEAEDPTARSGVPSYNL